MKFEGERSEGLELRRGEGLEAIEPVRRKRAVMRLSLLAQRMAVWSMPKRAARAERSLLTGLRRT